MDLASVSGFVAAHREGLAFAALAFATTMRDSLPWPLNKVDFFNWLYAWSHDAIKTMVNLRSGSAPTVQRPPEAKPDGVIPPVGEPPTTPPLEKKL